MKPAMKISVELSHQCPLDELTDHAKAFDSQGFYRVWVPDTLVSPWEAWMAASILAQNTEQVLIGLGVTNPFTRHPVVMAQMAATLQRFSNNRLSISLVKGIQRFLEKAGIEPSPYAEKECVLILRSLLSGEKTDFQGQTFRIKGIRLRTLPGPPVPLYLACVGREAWKQALGVADGVVTFWNPEAEINRAWAMEQKPIQTSAMVPFSLSGKEFFGQTIQSLEDLGKKFQEMEAAGFDEGIIAYRDLKDLEAAASLIKA
ncbi:MAG: LLM class flavin-dependent oxidoreductase [Proteobacteria bacterium]|nr:LLM class flavin-dependent oxidoreductase [Pseudomonadota bacterium]